MTNPTPSYFLASSWDLPPPPIGPIRLGNVITSIDEPHEPLYTASMMGVPTKQQNFTFSMGKSAQHRVGFFSRFLSFVTGLGLDMGVNFDRNKFRLFSCESLETTHFEVSPGYLETCVANESVKRYLAKSHYKKPIFVITGLKIASHSKVYSMHTQATSGEFSAEIDGTSWGGLPITLGPDIASENERHLQVSWEKNEDFVFAFQVRKVLVVEETDSVKRHEMYKKGALLDDTIIQQDESKVRIIAEEVPSINAAGYVGHRTMDEGKLTVWSIPDLQDDREEESD